MHKIKTFVANFQLETLNKVLNKYSCIYLVTLTDRHPTTFYMYFFFVYVKTLQKKFIHLNSKHVLLIK